MADNSVIAITPQSIKLEATVHCAVAIRQVCPAQNMFMSRSRCFSKGVGHFRRIFDSEGGMHHPPTTVGVRKLERLPFRVVSKYPQSI